jgi:hypothetical protein
VRVKDLVRKTIDLGWVLIPCLLVAIDSLRRGLVP